VSTLVLPKFVAHIIDHGIDPLHRVVWILLDLDGRVLALRIFMFPMTRERVVGRKPPRNTLAYLQVLYNVESRRTKYGEQSRIVSKQELVYRTTISIIGMNSPSLGLHGPTQSRLKNNFANTRQLRC